MIQIKFLEINSKKWVNLYKEETINGKDYHLAYVFELDEKIGTCLSLFEKNYEEARGRIK